MEDLKQKSFPYGVTAYYLVGRNDIVVSITDNNAFTTIAKTHSLLKDVISLVDFVESIYEQFLGRLTVNVVVDRSFVTEEKSQFQIDLEQVIENTYYLKVFSTYNVQKAATGSFFTNDMYNRCIHIFKSHPSYVTDYFRRYIPVLTPGGVDVTMSTIIDQIETDTDYIRIVARFVDICNGIVSVDSRGFPCTDKSSILLKPNLTFDEANVLFMRGIHTIEDWNKYEGKYNY